MRSWCERHPIGFMALYLVFYLAFFAFLESAVTVPAVWVHCRLDDLIPFCKYAVVPYLLWFLWVPGTLLYLLFRGPRAEFWRFCLPLFAGMTLALLFCLAVPNGVALRPRTVPGDDIFARCVRMLYRSDTATNVCPSIHVFNAVTTDLAVQRSSCFAGQRRLRRWLRMGSWLLDLAVIASTMLLKQHSVIDVVCGILLAFALDGLAASALHEPVRERRRVLKRT